MCERIESGWTKPFLIARIRAAPAQGAEGGTAIAEYIEAWDGFRSNAPNLRTPLGGMEESIESYSDPLEYFICA